MTKILYNTEVKHFVIYYHSIFSSNLENWTNRQLRISITVLSSVTSLWFKERLLIFDGLQKWNKASAMRCEDRWRLSGAEKKHTRARGVRGKGQGARGCVITFKMIYHRICFDAVGGLSKGPGGRVVGLSRMTLHKNCCYSLPTDCRGRRKTQAAVARRSSNDST